MFWSFLYLTVKISFLTRTRSFFVRVPSEFRPLWILYRPAAFVLNAPRGNGQKIERHRTECGWNANGRGRKRNAFFTVCIIGANLVWFYWLLAFKLVYIISFFLSFLTFCVNMQTRRKNSFTQCYLFFENLVFTKDVLFLTLAIITFNFGIFKRFKESYL